MSHPSWLSRVVELAARLYVFLFINVYGWGKMAGGQFHRAGRLPEKLAQTPLTEVGGFDLAWTFFGYSRAYVLFIGLSQVIGGFLLLWSRTKLLGITILIPILLNIIIVDLSFGIPIGAMWGAVIYLFLLLFVLYWNREKVVAAVVALTRSDLPEGETWQQRWVLVAAAGAAVVVMFLVELFVIRPLE